MKRIIGIGLAILLLSCSAVQGRYTKAANKALRNSVSIYVTGLVVKDKKLALLSIMGSGVWISDNGHILTCAHLFDVHKGLKFVIFEDYHGTMAAAEVLYVSKKYDLALLKTFNHNSKSFVRIAHPLKVKVGQEVIVVGNPLGLDFTVTNGIISALYRDLGKNYNMVQSNASLNPGNSGGGVFNLKGELVGINSFMISPIAETPVFTGLGFSVSSSEIIRFLGKFKGIYNAVKPRK